MPLYQVSATFDEPLVASTESAGASACRTARERAENPYRDAPTARMPCHLDDHVLERLAAAWDRGWDRAQRECAEAAAEGGG